MSLRPTLNISKPGSESRRATVPMGIVAFLELQRYDKIIWKMEIVNDERVVIVTREKRSELGSRKRMTS